MIIKLARSIKAFSALCAYVLVLNVLLAGFAQAAMIDHSLNKGDIICTIDTPDAAPNGNSNTQGPVHDCKICCLAAHGTHALPPIVNALLARLTTVSALLFPLETTGVDFETGHFSKARAPPFI